MARGVADFRRTSQRWPKSAAGEVSELALPANCGCSRPAAWERPKLGARTYAAIAG